jgi:hypothetical protein
MQFTATSNPQIDLDISCFYKLISKSYYKHFLGIYVIDSALDLKIYTEGNTYNSNTVSYAEISVKSFTIYEH